MSKYKVGFRNVEEWHPCHAEFVSVSRLSFGFDLKFEL
jgi:hypothetical protein